MIVSEKEYVRFLWKLGIKYYPAHHCGCPCKGLIEVKRHHIDYKIPTFLTGHNCVGEKASVEKRKNLSIAAKKYRNDPNNQEELLARAKKISKSKTGICTLTREQIDAAAEKRRGCKHSPESIAKRIASRAGYTHSEETIEKIRESNIGKEVKEETKEKLRQISKELWDDPEYRAKQMEIRSTPEYIEKQSKAWFKEGEENIGYIHGKGYAPYSKEFYEKRPMILERDNHECQVPYCKGNCEDIPVGVHHIDLDKDNNDEFNMLTACTSCNTRANWHPEWQPVLRSIINDRQRK